LIDSGQVSGPGSHLSGVTLSRWADDGPVSNDNARNLEVGLKSFLHNNTGLLESLERSVRNSDQKVLLSAAISLLVVDHLGRVQKDDFEMLLEVLMLGAKRAEGLGDILLELGGLFVVLLDDFVSIMEHVCCIFVL